MDRSAHWRCSADELRSAASGQWRAILIAAGIPTASLNGHGHPCPKCGGKDRFAAFASLDLRGAVHCRHCFTAGSNPRPGDGFATLIWWLGCSFPESLEWISEYLGLGRGTERDGIPAAKFSPIVRPSVRENAHRVVRKSHVKRMTDLTIDAMRRVSIEQLRSMSSRLSVSIDSLRALCVGYSSDHRASTWPMRDGAGQIIGIRLREIDGNGKWAVRESLAGLFMSRKTRASGERLFIVEGPSDLAAAIDLGLPSIGRPNCFGFTHDVASFMKSAALQRATIIADNDNPGIQGASQLAKHLSKLGFDSDVVTPPECYNDLRCWVQSNATGNEVREREPILRFTRQTVKTQLRFDFGLEIPSSQSPQASAVTVN